MPALWSTAGPLPLAPPGGILWRGSSKLVSPIGISDNLAQRWDYARAVTDPVGITGAQTFAQGFNRSATDPLGLTDAATFAAIHGVVFDTVGAGNDVHGQSTTTTTTSWSQSATAGAYALAFMSTLVNNGTTSAVSATYGGVAMTQLARIHQNNSSTSGELDVFGLAGVAGGAQTVAVSATASVAVSAIAASSVSYLNVGSAGTPTTNFGSTASMSVSGTGAANGLVVGALGASQSSALTISGFSQTQRYVHNSTGSDAIIVIGDSATVGALTFSASLAGTAPFWSGAAIVLTP